LSAARAGRWSSIACALSSLVLVVGTAHAEPEPMRDATPIEVSSLLAVGAAGLALDLFPPGVASPRWTGGVLFDDGVRSALAQTSLDGRARAATASDVGIGTLVAFPFVDAAFAVGLAHHDAHAAVELALTDLEAFSVTEALTAVSKRAFARQRPEAQEAGCDGGAAGAQSTVCARSDRNASFWSGHSAHAFTAAALACTEHARLGIYGAPWDALTCAAALTAAAGVGTLRIVADRHWTSDVLVGATVGTLSGWLVPTVLRFRAPRGALASIVPSVVPIEGGVALGVAGVVW